MNDKTKAYIAAVSYSAAIGFSFLCIKVCLQSASSINILAHRFLIAGAVAIIVFLARRKNFTLKGKDIGIIACLALLYPLAFFFLQTGSLIYIDTVEAGIIQAMTPIFTLFLAFFMLQERTTLIKAVFVLLSVGGVLFIFLMNGASADAYNAIGVLMIGGATFAISLYTVLIRRMTRRYSTFELTTVMALVGCIVFCLAAVGVNVKQGTMQSLFTPFTDFSYVAAVVFLGIASSYLSSFLSNYALSKLPATQMSIFNNLSTIITVFVGAVFLNEGFYWYHAVGAVAVITGILGMSLSGNSQKDKK